MFCEVPRIAEDEVAEAKDKVTYDPKTGKLTGWEHEGDWKKSKGKKKDPVGKIHNMSDVARRRTEKMTSDETLEEAFERALGEERNVELEVKKQANLVLFLYNKVVDKVAVLEYNGILIN